MAPVAQVFFPIRELSAYHTKWTIRARVTVKSPTRTFNGRNGAGQVFHVELLDAEGGEIRASFFGQAVDMYSGKLVEGKVYTFSRGSVKIANRQFNTCRHRYEITFDKDGQIEEVPDDAQLPEIKNESFAFVDIRSLQSRTLPCRVDLCAVITTFKPAVTITTKENKELMKRDITVADDSGTSFDVALFGDLAKLEDSKFAGSPIAGLKSVLVKEWNGGRSGSLSGRLTLGLEGPEADRVRQWWSGSGNNQALTTLSVASSGGGIASRPLADTKVLSLEEMKNASAASQADQEFFTCVARLGAVQLRKQGQAQPIWYEACAEQRPDTRGLLCNKRVESGSCPSCGRETKTQTRLLARCRYVDFGDSAWLTTFNEAAQHVFKMTADEAKILEKESGAGGEALENALKQKYFGRPVVLTVKSKQEVYNGMARTGVSVMDARPVNYAEHGRKMLSEITEMLGQSA